MLAKINPPSIMKNTPIVPLLFTMNFYKLLNFHLTLFIDSIRCFLQRRALYFSSEFISEFKISNDSSYIFFASFINALSSFLEKFE